MRSMIFVLAMLASTSVVAEVPASLSGPQFDAALQQKGDPARGKAVSRNAPDATTKMRQGAVAARFRVSPGSMRP